MIMVYIQQLAKEQTAQKVALPDKTISDIKHGIDHPVQPGINNPVQKQVNILYTKYMQKT